MTRRKKDRQKGRGYYSVVGIASMNYLILLKTNGKFKKIYVV